jgi:hypothetical protein
VEGKLVSDSNDREAVLSGFFQRVADAFLSGDHEWLSGIYIYPLVVYIDEEIFLEHTPEETLATLFERREAAYRAGTQSIRSTVLMIGSHEVGRFPVRVDWEFINAAGNVVAKNELRYFCRFDEEGHTRIEILEFLKRGFPNPNSTVTRFKH